MKAVVTLVQVAEDGDIAKHAAAVDAAISALREARQHEAAADGRVVQAHEAAASARQATSVARLDLGRRLAAARSLWPTRGRGSKAWTEFLAARGIDPDSALDAMKYAGYVEENYPGASENAPGQRPLPTMREAGLDKRPRAGESDHGQYGAKDPVLPRAADAEPPPFRQLTADDLIQQLGRLPPEEKARVLRAGKANVNGGSGEPDRGSWCTPKALAIAVGPWDLDPFSNPRSHVLAANRCMLENSGDGFGDGSGPGSYRVGNRAAEYAGPETRVWLQPPYERQMVGDVVDHYKHTRFCALLRWSPDVVGWFARLWPYVHAVAFPRGERVAFEPPPGLEDKAGAGSPHSHALYYASQHDITDEIRATCIVWLVDHSSDPLPDDPSAA